VRLLDDLPDLGEDGWYRQTVLGRLQDLHYHLLALIVDLVTDDADADIEQMWLDKFGELLTPAEAALLRRVASQPRRIDLLLRWWDGWSDDETEAPIADDDVGQPEATRTHPLLRLADAYHKTIADLVRRTDASAERDGDDVDAGRTEADGSE